MHSFLNRLLWVIILVLLQVLVFNHVHLLGYATPMVYVYILCLQPCSTPRYEWLLWGFVTGLLVDFFSAMPGVGAASMTLTAMCAPVLFKRFIPKDSADFVEASFSTLGRWSYVAYVLLLVFIQHASFILLECFSFFRMLDMLIAFASSVVLTMIFILALESMRSSRK